MPATYEPIATTTLGSAAASITFSSIASSWTDLRVVLVGTTTTAGNVAECRLNGDTATNYSETTLTGDGATASSNRTTNRTALTIGDSINGSSTSIPQFISIDLFSYAGSTNKTLLTSISNDLNGSGVATRRVGLWRNTSAITSIVLNSNDTWKIGTTATLYGIKNA